MLIYRDPEAQMSRDGWCFTTLCGAIHYIGILDASMLSIDPEEFQIKYDQGIILAKEEYERKKKSKRSRLAPHIATASKNNISNTTSRRTIENEGPRSPPKWLF